MISECPVSAFADICAASNFGKGTILYIFDSEDELVYTTDSSDGISKSLLSNVKSHGKTEINGKEYLPVSSAVADTGWSVVAAVPYNFITASAQTLFNRLVTLSLICAAVIIIITAAVSFYFTRPIKVLQLSRNERMNSATFSIISTVWRASSTTSYMPFPNRKNARPRLNTECCKVR